LIETIVKKEVIISDIVNIWANSISLRRILKEQDDLYLDEVYLLSLIFVINRERPAMGQDFDERFNILSYKRAKMLDNLIKRGLVKDDREGKKGHFKPHKYIVTPLGEQLLIKYEKVMQKLCNG
jgi:hypothetical protein